MKTRVPVWYTVQAIVGTLIEEAALAEYKAIFDGYVSPSGHFKPPARQPHSIHGSYTQIGNNPDGSPTFKGARLRVFSLLLLAGNLELPVPGLQPVLRSVI